MNDNRIRTMRLSETVSPFGPGAIVDILGESFMAPTAEQWPPSRMLTELRCDQLASKLNVSHFYAAPVLPSEESRRSASLEFARFPAWLFCQECRRMVDWKRSNEKGRTPACLHCNGRLVPMRFVAVCTTKSHVADVPWADWLHRPSEGDCRSREQLSFLSRPGRAEGLSSLLVRCGACKANRDLGDLRGEVLQREGIRCLGNQPWSRSGGECGEPLEVQQRGATSLHFGEVLSAIDIPPVESRADELQERISGHVLFDALKALEIGSAAWNQLVIQVSLDLETTPDEVTEMIREANGEPATRKAVVRSVLDDEFEAFIRALDGDAPTQDFVTRAERETFAGDSPVFRRLREAVNSVLLVERLREVRVIEGFRRHTPDADLVPAVLLESHETRWLPAVEGWGEGIFLRLDASRLDEWAERSDVAARVQPLAQNQVASKLGSRLHDVSPQYVLLHQFAHALMQDLAFVSGYTAPSLRERIYASKGDYGVFIYTTTSDVEGTLGGLIRQGERDLLPQAIGRALQQASWCPNDPVCSETKPQNIDGLNLAACHSCSLAPETSCESQNLLLDRALLSDPVIGFFTPLIDELVNAADAAS